ncbi:hypothetical protein CVT26_000592 [Gymnopilus dilepis]|uniref:Uncharacterized protein n=1 Tax=Gymnopilus dilepis TaxID=231916 RepID=A0A409WW75_9AGAR|nr:hypothetical protein CVT26_000592 [Gymnopilus dilepis]
MVLSFLDNDNGNGNSVCNIDKDTYVYWGKEAKELAEKYLANRTPDSAAQGQAQAPASAPSPTDLIVYQGERAKDDFSLAGFVREVAYWASWCAKWAYGLPLAWRLIVTVVLPALVAPFFVIGKGRKYRKAEPQVNEKQVVEDTELDQDVETETQLENGQDLETETQLADGNLEKDQEDQETFEYVQDLKTDTPLENGDLQAQDDKDAGEKFVYTGTSSIISDSIIDDTELNATTVSSWDFGSNNRQDENGQGLPGTARATEIDRENIPSSHSHTHTNNTDDDGHLRVNVNALDVDGHRNALNVDGHHSDSDAISTCATYDPSPEVSFDPINEHLPPAPSASDVSSASVPLVDLSEDGKHKHANVVGRVGDEAAGAGAGKRTREKEAEERREERASSLGSFNDLGASIHAPVSAIPPLEERLTRVCVFVDFVTVCFQMLICFFFLLSCLFRTFVASHPCP